jgi:hypothetical protein
MAQAQKAAKNKEARAQSTSKVLAERPAPLFVSSRSGCKEGAGEGAGVVVGMGVEVGTGVGPSIGPLQLQEARAKPI